MDILQKLKNNQRRIGLTGGIGSGKTTIINYIRKHKNIPILDADSFSRELIKPNSYGYKKILDYFGNQIIANKNNPEKEINRKLLRNIIFKNSESGHTGTDQVNDWKYLRGVNDSAPVWLDDHRGFGRLPIAYKDALLGRR